MEHKIIKIAVLGPESSGKSELCEKLATHYNTTWIKEYAREYLTLHPAPYTMSDVEFMYRTQYKKEQQAIPIANKLLFTDTEFIIAKVWCEFVFHENSEWIEKMLQSAPYDFYLLTYPDLPWEYDPLRENPGKGIFFFDWYQKILNEHKFKYSIIRGIGSARLMNAVASVDKFIGDAASEFN